MDSNTKKKIVNYFLKKGILLSPEIIRSITEENYEKIFDENSLKNNPDFLILTKDVKEILKESGINWTEVDKVKTLEEKGKFAGATVIPIKTEEKAAYKEEEEQKKKNRIKIIYSYKENIKKREVQDFVQYFNKRHKTIEKILKNRRELSNIISINRLKTKKEREHVSLIGIIKDKSYTKNKNLIITLEDSTGETKVLINKNRQDLFKYAGSIVLDEIIAINGVNAENIVFADALFFPDVPISKELKKSPDETYALFLSDIHVGSDNFLEKDFNKFLRWINKEAGNEKQKEIASKVKYIFIVGDLVDGCGVYPGQEEELVIKDIYEQYEKCAELLRKIPEYIEIIICPGNHDAMRIAEPQPIFYEEYAKPLLDMPNTTIVTNPSTVNIHSSETFPGFDVLMYHGYSFDYYISEVDTIRNNGGYDRADLVMKFLLQKRHLAPTHTSTRYIPENSFDPLVIEKVPDFFVSGHVHKSIAANYRNVTLVCGSCWQAKTAFQEKVGHNPEPSRIPLVNLKTRQLKILKFSS